MSAPIDPRRFVVEHGGERADKFLADQLPGVGRKALAEAFAAGRVRVAGKPAKKGQLLVAGQTVELSGELHAAASEPPTPEPGLPLDVVHADAQLLVVAKPAGMATHPLAAGERGTLAGAVVARYPECATAATAAREGGAAHRLDRGTSGLVVFARDRATWDALRAAFAAGQVHKTYLALVAGRVSHAGELDMPIAQRGKKVVVGESIDGLPALTRWQVGERFAEHTLLTCEAETGRMHQIRAHLATAGTPIVGDELYGGPPAPPLLVGFFLHADTLAFPHPQTGQPLRLTAPLPADRAACLAALRA